MDKQTWQYVTGIFAALLVVSLVILKITYSVAKEVEKPEESWDKVGVEMVCSMENGSLYTYGCSRYGWNITHDKNLREDETSCVFRRCFSAEDVPNEYQSNIL